MEITADCIPCLMKRALFQSRLIDAGADFRSTEAALKAFAENIAPGKKSVDVATEVHRASYAAIGSDDPYLDLKVRADEVAERFMERASALVEASDNPLRTAIELSVVGNIMDFGSGIAIDDPSEFENMFDDLVAQGLGVDDSDKLAEILKGDGSVIYIFDNCGESQLDRILIRYLRSTGKRIVGVVRGRPILNDVTVDDAVRSGLSEDLDAMMTTGKFYVGIDWADLPPDLSREIEGSDVIIAKGMANYESLSDEALPIPIMHILRSKCVAVANSMGVPVETNVARITMPGADPQ